MLKVALNTITITLIVKWLFLEYVCFSLLYFYINDYFFIPDLECKTTDRGTEYIGFVNITQSGIECQRWDLYTPHYSYFTDQPENYCRNPDSTSGGPWCYTTNSSIRWELCGIPKCRKWYIVWCLILESFRQCGIFVFHFIITFTAHFFHVPCAPPTNGLCLETDPGIRQPTRLAHCFFKCCLSEQLLPSALPKSSYGHFASGSQLRLNKLLCS